MGRARSEHPEGNSCPMSPHKDQNSVRAQPLSSSHPPCPWQRTCFWTGLTRFESKSKNLLWDVSPRKSPSSHPINKSRSWHNSEQGSQVCWATPKRKGAPRDTIQLSETLWKMSQASRSVGNTGLVVLGAFSGVVGEEFPYVVLFPLLLKSISLRGELALEIGNFLLFACNPELTKGTTNKSGDIEEIPSEALTPFPTHSLAFPSLFSSLWKAVFTDLAAPPASHCSLKHSAWVNPL